MSFFSLLTDSCTINIKNPSRSSTTGGLQPGWLTGLDAKRCLVHPTGADEFQQDMREAGVEYFDVYFEYPCPARSSDRILPTTGAASGSILECVSNPIDMAGQKRYTKIRCRLVKGGGIT